MSILKCKMCGGNLQVEEGQTVCECEYCGTKQTIPSVDDEKKLNLYNRANRLRSNNEFDKAYGVFESLVADFPEESEAYWGLCLCKYGIEYVDDPLTGKKIPTCHRTSYDSIFDDNNFEMALEYADGAARGIYREEAKEIDRLQKAILEIAKNEDPFDIFICYKETDEYGDRTIDSVIAQDVYTALTDKGYKVFFSRITLEDKLGQEYEPYIFAALNSAKIMLAFGTSYDYYNAVWVKNEWSRYLDLMKKDKNKYLIPCYKGIDAYDMPKEFAHLQAQDMGKVGALQDLLRGIEKIIPSKTVKMPAFEVSTNHIENDFIITSGTLIKYVGKSDKVIIPDNVSVIGKEAFADRKDVTSVLIPNSVTSIEFWAFKDCAKLVSVNIPDSVTNIGRSAFEGCKALTSISLPNSITSIDDDAFNECISLTSVSLPNSITKIGHEVFWGCKGLTTITIPDSILSIGNSAFFGCESLTSITIPDSVTSIGSSAFALCSSLKSIKVSKNNPVYDSRNDCNAIIESSSNTLIFGCQNTEIPNGITSVGENAFLKCSGLSSIRIPNSVTSIGEQAFQNCTGLKSVEIPNSVTYIGNSAFWNCEGLKSITIPSSVTTIGDHAFHDCEFTSLIIQNRATKIGDFAFKRYWEKKGLCPKCGGELKKPLFSKKIICSKCGW